MKWAKGSTAYVTYIGADDKLHIDKCVVGVEDAEDRYRIIANNEQYVGVTPQNLFPTYKEAIDRAFKGTTKYIQEVLNLVIQNADLGDLKNVVKRRYENSLKKLIKDVQMKIDDMKQ